MYVVQRERCLLAHSWVCVLCFISPSLASRMEKFERRCDAEQHQEPEKCWCCSEGVDVVEMVSVVLQRETQVCPALGSLHLDVIWLPDLPDRCLSAKSFSLTFPSQCIRRAA